MAGAVEILYRLRSHQPEMPGFGYSQENREKANAAFFSGIDALVYSHLNRMMQLKDDAALRSLAEYLGVSNIKGSKLALPDLAQNPAVAEQALICLGWHKDQKDMEDLMAFMLRGDRASWQLPYVFRNSYGAAAVPYLKRALAESPSSQVRLQAAFQLVHLKENDGVKYLYEMIARRNEMPNGAAQA